MAIKSFSFTLSILSALVLTGCQLRTVRQESPRTAPLTVGPPLPEKIEQPELPARGESKRVALILGPGGAKAFAHVGVLKALHQQRIPIEKIVGLEWGALVGGLYAQKGQIHEVEWKLYKLEQQAIMKPKNKGFFSRGEGPESISALNGFFQDSFGAEEIANSKIGFGCPSRSVWTGVVAWQNRGPFREAMKRCLPFPPIFKVQGTFLAGASQGTEAVEMLAKEGFNVIILVNVLGSAAPVGREALLENLNHVILWQEIKRAIQEVGRLNVEVINVDTSNFAMVQFEAKKDLILMGEVAGQKAASALISKYGF